MSNNNKICNIRSLIVISANATIRSNNRSTINSRFYDGTSIVKKINNKLTESMSELHDLGRQMYLGRILSYIELLRIDVCILEKFLNKTFDIIFILNISHIIAGSPPPAPGDFRVTQPQN